MKYELAKKLKDAGFPQDFSLEELLVFATANNFLITDKPKTAMEISLLEDYELKKQKLIEKYSNVKGFEEKITMPSLSELVEACGEKFGSLFGVREFTNAPRWSAFSKHEVGEKVYSGKGETAEEAIANLWLELNSNE